MGPGKNIPKPRYSNDNTQVWPLEPSCMHEWNHSSRHLQPNVFGYRENFYWHWQWQFLKIILLDGLKDFPWLVDIFVFSFLRLPKKELIENKLETAMILGRGKNSFFLGIFPKLAWGGCPSFLNTANYVFLAWKNDFFLAKSYKKFPKLGPLLPFGRRA